MKLICFSLLMIFLIGSVSAGIIIKSVPEKTEWIADGVTEYRMDVIADTTGFDKLINNVGWGVIVPAGLIVKRAELPSQTNPSDNPDDFFYNWLMFGAYNRVDSTIRLVNGRRELEDNTRMVAAVFDGVPPRQGILGSYWFVVPENVTGNLSFGLNNVAFASDDEVSYNILNGVTIQNIPFVVKAPAPAKKPGDMNNDTQVNVLDLIYIKNRMNTEDLTGDANSDGWVNVLDLIYVRNRLGS